MENENNPVKSDRSDTETRKKEFLSAISDPKNRGIVSNACNTARISRETYYNWLKTDPDFAEEAAKAKNLGKESFEDVAENALWDLVMQGEKSAVIFVAKTRLKNRGFSDTQEIKIDNQGESIGISVKTSQHRGND